MPPTNYIQENEVLVDAPADSNHSSQFNFDTEIELNSLEELITNSTNIPLTELTVVDRDLLLHQLNLIKQNLPTDFATATEIAKHRQKIIEDAEGYACLIVKAAEEKASQILQESSIVRQAELEGAKMRMKVERECETLKQTAQAEIEQLRHNAIAESIEIQQGADNYADRVLGDIEQRLQEMLGVIQNGRQQLDR